MVWNKLFGRKRVEVEPVQHLPIIHEITFGRTAVINQVAVATLGPDHKFRLASSALTVTGQGHVKLEDGIHIHRFYGDDHTLLQVTGGDGFTEQGVQNITVFIAAHTIEPATNTDLLAEIERLKASTYEFDGVEYSRVWFDGDGPADPVKFHETVYLEEDKSESYGIQQTCMLFERDVDGVAELLLVSHEKTDNGDERVSMMIGIELSPSDVSL